VIGEPLIAKLIRAGHTVTGMIRSENGVRRLNEQGGASTAQPRSVEYAETFSRPGVFS
jgi:hypothetical protein